MDIPKSEHFYNYFPSNGSTDNLQPRTAGMDSRPISKWSHLITEGTKYFRLNKHKANKNQYSQYFYDHSLRFFFVLAGDFSQKLEW